MFVRLTDRNNFATRWIYSLNKQKCRQDRRIRKRENKLSKLSGFPKVKSMTEQKVNAEFCLPG